MRIPAIFKKEFIQQLAGFSFVGAFVTLLSLVLLYLFVEVFAVNVYLSYSVVYFLSIGVSYLLNGKVVFKAAVGLKWSVYYYLIYLSGMGIGLLLIVFSNRLFEFNDFIDALVVLPFTMLWNFFFIRYLFAKSNQMINKTRMMNHER